MEKVTSILIAAVLLVVLLLFALMQVSTVQSETDKLKAAGTLPGCCLSLASPTNNVCSGTDDDVTNFECEVPKEISKIGKMKILEVFKKVNKVESVTAEQIRNTCQCMPLATAG